MSEHNESKYVKIWATLLVLLIVSIIGPMLEIKIVTLITAFGIAAVKAYLVAKYFMHLNVEKKYIIYALVLAVGFMVLLFAGTAPDVMKHEGMQWSNEAAKTHVEQALEHAEEHPEGH